MGDGSKIHAEDVVYKDSENNTRYLDGLFNNIPRLSNANYDDLPSGLVYVSTDHTNGPANYCIVLTVCRSDTTKIQMAISAHDGKAYTRGRTTAGGWSNWVVL